MYLTALSITAISAIYKGLTNIVLGFISAMGRPYGIPTDYYKKVKYNVRLGSHLRRPNARHRGSPLTSDI